MADRAADKDYATLQSKGLTLEIKEITALELYNTLLEQGQWYIGYKDGSPILPHGVFEHTQRMRHQQYLQDRDADCKKRQ